MKRSVVLVGLSGAGKTSVGQTAAERLGTTCVDIDAVIEAREGISITAFFQDRGEPAFRTLERALVDEAIGGEPRVVIPGGGWAAEPGNLASVRGSACAVWLTVDPTEAARRLSDAGDRPLLEQTNPIVALRGQLEEREAFYELAEGRCATDGRSVSEVADAVVALAQRLAGW